MNTDSPLNIENTGINKEGDCYPGKQDAEGKQDCLLLGKKILLVDDIEANQYLAKMILERKGAHISTAWNGQEAIDIMEQQHFDVVLMDLQMPVKDGIEATRIIRQNNRETPIIALTANTISGEPDKCREVGMNGFLAKPYKEKDLLELIYQSLNINYNIIRETVNDENNPGEQLYSLNNLLAICGDNKEFLEMMVEIFVNDLQETCTALQSALNEKNYPVIKSLAHKIKPSLETFEIPFYSEIRRIELLTLFEDTEEELQQLIIQFKELATRVIAEMKTINYL